MNATPRPNHKSARWSLRVARTAVAQAVNSLGQDDSTLERRLALSCLAEDLARHARELVEEETPHEPLPIRPAAGGGVN